MGESESVTGEYQEKRRNYRHTPESVAVYLDPKTSDTEIDEILKKKEKFVSSFERKMWNKACELADSGAIILHGKCSVKDCQDVTYNSAFCFYHRAMELLNSPVRRSAVVESGNHRYQAINDYWLNYCGGYVINFIKTGKRIYGTDNQRSKGGNRGGNLSRR